MLCSALPHFTAIPAWHGATRLRFGEQRSQLVDVDANGQLHPMRTCVELAFKGCRQCFHFERARL
jgi:hypothetical protein